MVLIERRRGLRRTFKHSVARNVACLALGWCSTWCFWGFVVFTNKDHNAATPISLLTQPDVSNHQQCSSTKGQLVTFVLSARGNQKRRNAIRQTWGSRFSVFFVLGENNLISNSTSVDIEAEQKKHRDLIVTNAPESYSSLPHKLRYALHWLDTHCDDGIRWALKVDDDMFCHVAGIEQLLSRFMDSTTMTVLGHVLVGQAVKNYGKWRESKYLEPIYPPFVQGSCGYVLSRPVVKHISDRVGAGSASNETLDYQGEDTSLGIWLHDQGHLAVEWWESAQFVNHARCTDDQALSIGHKMTPELLHQCWKKTKNLPNPLPRAPKRIDVAATTISSNGEYETALQRHEGALLAGKRESLLRQSKLEREKRRQARANVTRK